MCLNHTPQVIKDATLLLGKKFYFHFMIWALCLFCIPMLHYVNDLCIMSCVVSRYYEFIISKFAGEDSFEGVLMFFGLTL